MLTPAVLSLGKHCTYHWKSGRNPHLSWNIKESFLYYAFIYPSSSSSQESSSADKASVSDNRDVETQVSKRSEGMNEELRRDPLHDSTGTENQTNNSESEEVQRDISHELGSGRHSVSTHFPKDQNCEICLKTKITRSSCRRRANAVMPRAENFGDFTSADHKVLSEESRNNHRYAVVVQDLATQWLQSYPCKTTTSQETSKNPMKSLEPSRNPSPILESLCVDTTQIRNIPFGALVEYHPMSAKDQSRLHQFGSKVLPGTFLGYALYAVRIWKDKFIPMPRALKVTDAKAAVVKECEKLKKISGMVAVESQKQERCDQ